MMTGLQVRVIKREVLEPINRSSAASVEKFETRSEIKLYNNLRLKNDFIYAELCFEN